MDSLEIAQQVTEDKLLWAQRLGENVCAAMVAGQKIVRGGQTLRLMYMLAVTPYGDLKPLWNTIPDDVCLDL